MSSFIQIGPVFVVRGNYLRAYGRIRRHAFQLSWQGTTGVQFPAGAIIAFFLFTIESRPTLWPTQPSIQWVPGALTPGHEAGHSPPFSAEVKNARSYTPTPPIQLRGVVLN